MTRVAVVGHVEWVDFVPVERFPKPGEIIHASGAFARAAGAGEWWPSCSLSWGPTSTSIARWGATSSAGRRRRS